MADAPRVDRPVMRSVENSLDERFRGFGRITRSALTAHARGVYLDGYGAVFTLEINTASDGIPMMHLTYPEGKEQIHARRSIVCRS